MVPTFRSKTLITDLYSMNPPDSRGYYFFYHPIRQASQRQLDETCPIALGAELLPGMANLFAAVRYARCLRWFDFAQLLL
jgi:hypothetical protein